MSEYNSLRSFDFYLLAQMKSIVYGRGTVADDGIIQRVYFLGGENRWQLIGIRNSYDSLLWTNGTLRVATSGQ